VLAQQQVEACAEVSGLGLRRGGRDQRGSWTGRSGARNQRRGEDDVRAESQTAAILDPGYDISALPEWLLVDGSSMFFRAFYAIPQTMRGPGGTLVNAVRGTLDTLARYVTDRRPRHIAFTTDEDWRPDWRVELIPAYKQQRTAEPIPPALIPQVPIILAALEAVGVEVGVFRNANAEYLEKALRVVPPVRDLPIEVPRGKRDKYPEHPKKVAELGKKYGIDSSLERLIKALSGAPPVLRATSP